MARSPATRIAQQRKTSNPQEAILDDFSARLGIEKGRLRAAVKAAQNLEEPEFRVMEKLAGLAEVTPISLEAREELSEGVCQELEALWTSEVESDPLVEVDAAISDREAAASTMWARMRARKNRARVLQECVSAAEAGALANRSRQAVERQRRVGSLLALRVGREWRYPVWQFDIDGPAGLVPGLKAVLRNLRLSAFGASLWLTTPKEQLGDERPIELLRQRQGNRVLRLAKDHGQML